MKQLQDLEQKIKYILELNKKFKEENNTLLREKSQLQESNAKLENLLLKEHGTVDTLTQEKDALKVAIENLIESIDKFNAQKN